MKISAKHRRKTHSDFINEVFAQVENEYSILGEYVNAKTKLKMKHNICNHTWEIDPDKFLQGRRCPECSIKQRTEEATKNHEDFVKELFELVKEEYKVVGKYMTSREKIEMKHNVCNHTYSVYPYSFLAGKGSRCPHCNESKGEQKIRKWLQEKNINYEPQKNSKV